MMCRLTSNPRIAFVDLTFNWPPVGGCWVDTHHVLMGLQERGAQVRLICPSFQEYYPRGNICEEMPYPVQSIPFNRYTFNFSTVRKRFKKAVDQFGADAVFVTDGYHMKNQLLTALGPERCYLRFYAYELMCINLHYYRYHENKICEHGFFEDPKECERCWFRRMPAVGRAVQIGLGMKETHPKLHFSQEYLASLAFTKGYQHQLKENFSKLAGAIVYNDFMRDRLQPYVDTIHCIPSGVDAKRFFPNPSQRTKDDPVKIFLPGRANDPLKGLETLIQAGDQLHEQGLSFEVHYTAAMDCHVQRDWLINQGWVGQDELAEMYQRMDIVVVPSIWIEPFGITALEGMASGLPVVASKIGGLVKTVVHGKTGYHVEPGDSTALANALKRLVESGGKRSTLGQQARERAVNEYDWDHILDHYYIPLLEQRSYKPQKSRQVG